MPSTLQQTLSFTCTCGLDSAAACQSAATRAGQRILGFANCLAWCSRPLRLKTWRDGPDPHCVDRGYVLLETLPAKGSTATLWVEFPFFANADQPFWAFYQPPRTYFKNFHAHPEEIDAAGLVLCKMTGIGDVQFRPEAIADGGGAKPFRARIAVRVLETLPLCEIVHRQPIGQAVGREILEDFPTEHGAITRLDRFTLVSADGHGGTVKKALLFAWHGGRQHLMLTFERAPHAGFVFAGNDPLDAAAASRLASLQAAPAARP